MPGHACHKDNNAHQILISSNLTSCILSIPPRHQASSTLVTTIFNYFKIATLMAFCEGQIFGLFDELKKAVQNGLLR